MERTGWSGMSKHFRMPDHPVCGVKVGFADFFLMPQPPLLYQEGSCQVPLSVSNFKLRHYQRLLFNLPLKFFSILRSGTSHITATIT